MAGHSKNNMNKTAIIIQARTGSSRLPKKMTLPFYKGKCILELLVQRIKNGVEGTPVIVATTTEPGDDAIAQLCEKAGVECYRGSETDVLQRFIGAAETGNFEKVIRICADNLFLDVEALANLIAAYQTNDADYFSYQTTGGKPAILTHFGLWAIEGAKVDALKKAATATSEKLYHEHVTNYLYNHRDEFVVEFLPITSAIQQKEDLRLTIDTTEDFAIMQQIYAELDEKQMAITPQIIVDYLDAHSELYSVMNKIIKANQK